mmetsp:Transcript_7927/g.28192  ORF Transcript_7927/g.28192 Transcript_7927/m.28192 type:complete len:409 (+) Transcript_7927:1781-3007(+)
MESQQRAVNVRRQVAQPPVEHLSAVHVSRHAASHGQLAQERHQALQRLGRIVFDDDGNNLPVDQGRERQRPRRSADNDRNRTRPERLIQTIRVRSFTSRDERVLRVREQRVVVVLGGSLVLCGALLVRRPVPRPELARAAVTSPPRAERSDDDVAPVVQRADVGAHAQVRQLRRLPVSSALERQQVLARAEREDAVKRRRPVREALEVRERRQEAAVEGKRERDVKIGPVRPLHGHHAAFGDNSAAHLHRHLPAVADGDDEVPPPAVPVRQHRQPKAHVDGVAVVVQAQGVHVWQHHARRARVVRGERARSKRCVQHRKLGRDLPHGVLQRVRIHAIVIGTAASVLQRVPPARLHRARRGVHSSEARGRRRRQQLAWHLARLVVVRVADGSCLTHTRRAINEVRLHHP